MRRAWLSLALFFMLTGSGAATTPPRVEAFGRIPSVDSVVLSPGGIPAIKANGGLLLIGAPRAAPDIPAFPFVVEHHPMRFVRDDLAFLFTNEG